MRLSIKATLVLVGTAVLLLSMAPVAVTEEAQEGWIWKGFWEIYFWNNNTITFRSKRKVYWGTLGETREITDKEWEQYKAEHQTEFEELERGATYYDVFHYIGAAIEDPISQEYTMVVPDEVLDMIVYYKGLFIEDEEHAYGQEWNIYWPPLGTEDQSRWEKISSDTVEFIFIDPWHFDTIDAWLDYPYFYAGPGVTFVDAWAEHDSGDKIDPHHDEPNFKGWDWESNGYIYCYHITVKYDQLENLDISSMQAMLLVWNETTGFVAPGAPDKALKDKFEKHLKQLVEKPVPTPGEPTVLLGGPIANRFVTAYNDRVGVSFDGFNLVYQGVTYTPVWQSEDYAAVYAIWDNPGWIFVVEGCTRYGTEAAANFIRNNLGELYGGGVYILKWTDINGNGRYDPFDTVEIVVEP